MDFRDSFETDIVGGVLKAVCKICGRALTHNNGVMRMHYSMAHPEGATRTASSNHVGDKNMPHRGEMIHDHIMRPSQVTNQAKKPTFNEVRMTDPQTVEFITEPPLVATSDMQQSGGGMGRGRTPRPTSDKCEGKPQFHKMMASGNHCDRTTRDSFQAMRELNPSLNAMIQSTEQMRKILCDAAKQPLDKKRRIASSAVAMHDAYLHRLKACMSGSANVYNPMGDAFAPQSPAPHDGRTSPSSQTVEGEENESSLSSYAAIQKVKADIPKRFHGEDRQAKPVPTRLSESHSHCTKWTSASGWEGVGAWKRPGHYTFLILVA
jgi:hypothetical protein